MAGFAMPLRRLPSLSGLKAFEAAARRLSFKAAAQELSVTPGAVSQRIRALEDELGVTLFVRRPRAVSLTEAGRRLQPDLTEGFLQIRQAVDAVRPEARATLRVNSSGPTISKWLLPRLHRFTEQFPDLVVNLETEAGLNCFTKDPPDVAVRCTRQPGPGLFARRIHEEILIPVASPAMLERTGLRSVQDIANATFLHDSSMGNYGLSLGWKDWFDRAGLKPPSQTGGMKFARQAADQAVDAAIAGGGLGLGRSLLVFDALRDGRLVCPFGPVLRTGVSYFVVCSKGRECEPHIAAFMDWACEEAELLSTMYALHDAPSRNRV